MSKWVLFYRGKIGDGRVFPWGWSFGNDIKVKHLKTIYKVWVRPRKDPLKEPPKRAGRGK